jgi:hypothetical protein
MSELIYGVSGDIRIELGSPSEVEVPASHILIAQTRATRVVNGRLEKSFPDSIPFTSSVDVPVLITEIVNELSTFYVKRAKHKGIAPLSDEVKTEYWEKPMQMLQDILEEKVKLPELTATEADRMLAPQKDYRSTFQEDGELDWTIDSDKLEDISDSRE